MKKFLPILLAAVLPACSGFSRSHDDQIVTERVEQSLVRITGEDPATDRALFVCTGWAVDVRKYFTAAHCVPEVVMDMEGSELRYVLKTDGVRALALKIDRERDLALILTDIVKPVLVLRAYNPVRWENVQGMGFAHGLTRPMSTNQVVQFLNYNLDRPEIWPGIGYLHPFIGGMSGGPVFDAWGQVVGMVQRSSQYLGYGVGVDELVKFLKD